MIDGTERPDKVLNKRKVVSEKGDYDNVEEVGSKSHRTSTQESLFRSFMLISIRSNNFSARLW